ncbi:hypothetical protein Pan216_50600 [Planctomycetes bacterium Pan216]|uniref:DUF1559 domain-containing protein n=1 Tax=Kolteria novifilia TaxID=2527975 RepID=A0A518BB03_9BACT|nr:hypothetical protein Pan216_50600 [Planctomycetes bacterium Pan216]
MTHHYRAPSFGFTLVELLVVTATVGIMGSLLLPAVHQARETDRRLQCANNLKQIATALHNYHDAHDAFPYGFRFGTTQDRDCWFQRLLPYVGEEQLYEKYEAANPDYVWKAPAEVRQKPLPLFMCAADPAQPAQGGADTTEAFQGSYVGLHGNDFLGHQSSGIFYLDSSTSLTDIRDGAAHTLLMSEVIARGSDVVEGAWGAGGSYWGGAAGGGAYGFSAKESPNTSVSDALPMCKSNSWPNAPCENTVGGASPTGGPTELYARSYHPGGANAVLADGSVQFIGNSTDRVIFQAMGTIAGGETDRP